MSSQVLSSKMMNIFYDRHSVRFPSYIRGIGGAGEVDKPTNPDRFRLLLSKNDFKKKKKTCFCESSDIFAQKNLKWHLRWHRISRCCRVSTVVRTNGHCGRFFLVNINFVSQECDKFRCKRKSSWTFFLSC